MKKRIAMMLSLMLALSLALSVTAFAADHEVTEQDGSSKGVTTEIVTSINPTYTVTIPGNLEVEFDETSTDLGAITLVAAQIDPYYVVRVALTTDKELVNKADAKRTIPYTIKDSNGSEFTSKDYDTANQKTELTVDITQEAWDAAYAGEYSDLVTFTVSYVDTRENP